MHGSYTDMSYAFNDVGMNTEEAWDFIRGFDIPDDIDEGNAFNRLGRQIRQEFLSCEPCE